jgi:hypothetical protein
MKLVEIYVNDQEVAGEYIGQAFFESNGQEWEMTIRAASQAEAEALAKSRAEAYLRAWAEDPTKANEEFGVYPF